MSAPKKDGPAAKLSPGKPGANAGPKRDAKPAGKKIAAFKAAKETARNAANKGAARAEKAGKSAKDAKGPKGASAVKGAKASTSSGPKPRRRPTLPSTGSERCGTVALVGRPNVGKSSLLNALLGQKIAATTHKPQTTRRALRGVLTEGTTQLVFVDTPGLHEEAGGLFSFMLEEALDAAAGVDVLAFLVEADRGRQGINEADLEALKKLQARAPKTPVVLVISKVDVLEDKAVLLPLLSTWGAESQFSAYVPLSAHKKDNLESFVREVAKHLPEAPFFFPPDSLTDQSERDIAGELIREKAMLELQQEIPYRTAVLIEHFDESRRDDKRKPLVHVAAIIVVERDSHKSMVIGKGGQRIKIIGQRARQELEHLLQCQVHLELFVKVEKDWTSSGIGLRKVGYSR